MSTDDPANRRAATLSLAVATLLALVAGATVHRHAWIAAAGSATMLAIGVAWPHVSVRALRAPLDVGQRRARVGELTAITVTVANRLPVPIAMVAIELGDAPAAVVPMLGGWRRRTIALDLRAARRGVVDLAGARATCSFPFGLVAAARSLPWRGELIVWPARGPGPFPAPRRHAAQTDRATRAAQAIGGDELAGIRPHRAGDAMRHVHWKATARHDRLISRESHDGPRPPARVVLDLADADDQTCERAIARAAGAAEHYVGQGFGVELLVGDRAALVATDARSLGRLLDALARLDLCDARLRAAPSASARAGATLVVPDRAAAPREGA